MAKTIMIQGTASGVGKTTIALALCRIFRQDGYKVAPFKAQNMTANTYLSEKGEEIAVSQYLQAVAAGIPPSADMNPILLKPLPDQQGAQVIVRGKLFEMVDFYNFKDLRKAFAPKIADAYSRLCSEYEVIVMEGAGSPVELNLNRDDIVNMGMAKRAGAPVILVADIDRGGVFASLYGTLNLLCESERAYVKAVVVNGFRGEACLFKDGVAILEEITGLPVAGVVPYTDIDLPEEDSLFDHDSTPRLGADFESQFNTVANAVRKALDMELIYKILDEGI